MQTSISPFLRECWHEIVVSVSSFGHLSSHFLAPVVSFTVKSVILQQQLCPNLKVEKTVLELDFTVEALF